jgi:hypothetical protein
MVQSVLQADQRELGGAGTFGFPAGAPLLTLGMEFRPRDPIRHVLQHLLQRSGLCRGVGVKTRPPA